MKYFAVSIVITMFLMGCGNKSSEKSKLEYYNKLESMIVKINDEIILLDESIDNEKIDETIFKSEALIATIETTITDIEKIEKVEETDILKDSLISLLNEYKLVISNEYSEFLKIKEKSQDTDDSINLEKEEKLYEIAQEKITNIRDNIDFALQDYLKKHNLKDDSYTE